MSVPRHVTHQPNMKGKIEASIGLCTRCPNFAYNLLSWMLSDSHFSFCRSVPFPVLSILSKSRINLTVRRSVSEVSFKCEQAMLILILFLLKAYSTQGTTPAPKVNLIVDSSGQSLITGCVLKNIALDLFLAWQGFCTVCSHGNI